MASAARCIHAILLVLSGSRVHAGQLPPALFDLQQTSKHVKHVQTHKFTVTLNKELVPIVVDGREVSSRTAFWGTVLLGKPTPQRFSVVFDTGSGHFFVPSSTCVSDTCKKHNQYDQNISKSGAPINKAGDLVRDLASRDMIEIGYGTGEILGPFSREIVCISAPDKLEDSLNAHSPHCTQAHLITATSMTDEPFGEFKFDGVLGLGLPGLVVAPEFHILSQLAQGPDGIAPMFGYFISKIDEIASELTFGGRSELRSVGEPHWVPVLHPADGHWKVSIKGIRVGGESLEFCDDGQCAAIIDTGTSFIAAPFSISPQLIEALLILAPEGSSFSALCREFPGPVLEFEISDGYVLTLDPADYLRQHPWEKDYASNFGDHHGTHSSEKDTASVIKESALELVVSASNSSNKSTSTPDALKCYPSIMGLDMDELGAKVFLLGLPILRKYYTVYDQGNLRIGFAPSVQGVLESALS